MTTRGKRSIGRFKGRGRGQGAFGRQRSTPSEVPPSELEMEMSMEDSPGQYGEDVHVTQIQERESSEDLSTSMSRVSGASHGDHVPNNLDTRPWIQPYGNRFIPDITSRKITEILRQHFGVWPTWSKVSRENKELLFVKFREQYRWLPEHEAGIRNSWEHCHRNNLKNNIYHFKKIAKKKSNSNDPNEWKKYKPSCMSTEDWDSLCDGRFSESNYKEKCIKASQNRLTEKEGSIGKHASGSISFEEHRRRMEIEKGRPINQLELHDRVHRRQKGAGDYVNNKSKKVKEAYEDKYSQTHGSNSIPDAMFDTSMWVEACGGPNKGIIYGFGNTFHAREIVGGSSSSQFGVFVNSFSINEDVLQSALKKLVDEQLTQKREQMAKEREAASIRETSLIEETRRMFEELKKREEQLLVDSKKREDALMATLTKLMEKIDKAADGGGKK